MQVNCLNTNFVWIGQKHVISMVQAKSAIFGRNLTQREQGRIKSIGEFEKRHFIEPLLDALISDQSHYVRIAAYEALRRLNLLKYSSEEKHNAKHIHKLGLKTLKQYDNGHNLKQAIIDIRNRLCYVFFKNNPLPVKLLSRDLLESYNLDDDEIDDIRSGLYQITVGELLGKDHGGYVKRNGAQRECMLFNKTQKELNRSLFWHEFFHAIQHRHGRYQRGNNGFYKQELEASQFVIANRELLKLSPSEIKTEIMVWGRRLGEYMMLKNGVNK